MSTAGNTTIDDCEYCGGVWLDMGVFEQTLTREEDKTALLNAVNALQPLHLKTNSGRPETDDRFYIPCPHCEAIMDRRQFARISGVVVDVCKHHGIWLDHDELPRIIQFVTEGGLDAARRHQVDRQVNDLLRRRSNATTTLSSEPYYSPLRTSSGTALADVVLGVL
ncbi:MAG: zf-TFIIB domain-containing protein, partial [Pseudomonadota bacterium]